MNSHERHANRIILITIAVPLFSFAFAADALAAKKKARCWCRVATRSPATAGRGF
jgi:hypothetical protein